MTAEIIDIAPKQPARVLTLGDALVLAVFHTPGGLKSIVDRIHDVVGPHYGSRNTFAKLLHAGSYAHLNNKDRFRVWLILAAIGAAPDDFGANDEIVPLTFEVHDLRSALLLPHLDSNQEPIGFESGLVRLDDWRGTTVERAA